MVAHPYGELTLKEKMEDDGLKDGSLVKLVLKKGTRCIEGNNYLLATEEDYRDVTGRQLAGSGFYFERNNNQEFFSERGITLLQNIELKEGSKSYYFGGTYEGFSPNGSFYYWDAIESYKIIDDD